MLLGAAVLLWTLPSALASASTGTVALWHMDETSGTTMFDSVGTHNGTLHSVQLGQTGFSGRSYGFNGSSSYVAVPSTRATRHQPLHTRPQSDAPYRSAFEHALIEAR